MIQLCVRPYLRHNLGCWSTLQQKTLQEAKFAPLERSSGTRVLSELCGHVSQVVNSCEWSGTLTSEAGLAGYPHAYRHALVAQRNLLVGSWVDGTGSFGCRPCRCSIATRRVRRVLERGQKVTTVVRDGWCLRQRQKDIRPLEEWWARQELSSWVRSGFGSNSDARCLPHSRPPSLNGTDAPKPTRENREHLFCVGYVAKARGLTMRSRRSNSGLTLALKNRRPLSNLQPVSRLLPPCRPRSSTKPST